MLILAAFRRARSTSLCAQHGAVSRGLADTARALPGERPIELGVAFHSLRAVDIDVIASVVQSLQDDALCRCLHIHVAEQPAEVASCVRQHGLPPVALLASRALLSPRWALVHATHASAEELAQLRAAKATLVLCPTTEADLGDGCPAVGPYLESGGYIAIGSDSNIARSAPGELRSSSGRSAWARGRRNVLATPKAAAVADRLYQSACPAACAPSAAAPRARAAQASVPIRQLRAGRGRLGVAAVRGLPQYPGIRCRRATRTTGDGRRALGDTRRRARP